MALDLKIAPRFTPRPPRKAVSHATVLLLPDDREISARLTNVSRSGLTACAMTPMEAGICFGILLPGLGIRRAEVRWVEGLEFGARFKRDLTEVQFDTL